MNSGACIFNLIAQLLIELLNILVFLFSEFVTMLQPMLPPKEEAPPPQKQPQKQTLAPPQPHSGKRKK